MDLLIFGYFATFFQQSHFYHKLLKQLKLVM